jgi:hypothetical protein
MYFGSALANVCSIAIELEPKILYLGIAKSLEDTTVKFMASGV